MQHKPDIVPIVLKPGWLYFLRDRDYLTGEVGPYVKIGKTDYDRPVEERIDDHQTGNPRKVFSIHNMQVNSIDTIETYLHHIFAPVRVHGEWFKMDGNQVKEAIQEADELNIMIGKYMTEIEVATTIYNQVSNGVIRKATDKELSLASNWLEAKKSHIMAKNRVVLNNERLRRLMGNSKGIEGVIDLQQKVSVSTLDKSTIISKHHEIIQDYMTNKTSKSISSSFKPAHTNPQLRGLDKQLDLEIKKEKSLQTASSDIASFDENPTTRTAEIEKIHDEYLMTLGEERSMRIGLDLMVARAKAACGLNDGVEGLCFWKREQVVKEKQLINWKQFAEDYPEIAASNMTEEKHTIAFVARKYRAY